jgi:putative transcriptional regulator
MKQKRKLFDELMEGVDAMQQQREGKITLRSHEVEDLPPLDVDADLIRDTRERMRVSRAVFARRLHQSRASGHYRGRFFIRPQEPPCR